MNRGMIKDNDLDANTAPEKTTPFTIINCNARSLCPKIDSLIDCISETDAAVGVVTETWLDDARADTLRGEMINMSGLNMVTRCRKAAENGVHYGGVAVVWSEARCTLKKLDYAAKDYEILVCSGRMKGHSRHLVVVACYLPPGYVKQKGEEALAEVSEIITDLKRRFSDPYLIVAGDFNQWDVKETLLDFQDIKEVDVGPTRNSRQLDKIFTNMSRSIEAAGTLDPLESEDGASSDHRTAYCTMMMKRIQTFVWQKFTYRHFNEDSVKAFKEWVVFHEWGEVLEAEGSNRKAEAYQKTINEALDRFFPWRTTRRRSNEHPWMNKRIKKLIKDRKDLFWEE